MPTQKTKAAIAAITVLLALTLTVAAQAQTASGQSGTRLEGPQLDSSLLGKSIFNLLPSRERGGKADVRVSQTKELSAALASQIASNPSRTLTGYRVRIFNDNRQTARGDSEAAMERFKGLYPGIPAYRTFTSPFFKVTVGDYRTKAEATRLLQKLLAAYPSAFVVKETINYPIVYSDRSAAAASAEE